MHLRFPEVQAEPRASIALGQQDDRLARSQVLHQIYILPCRKEAEAEVFNSERPSLSQPMYETDLVNISETLSPLMYLHC